MNVTVEARRAAGLCVGCGGLMRTDSPQKQTRCYECRRIHASKQRKIDKRNKNYECLLPKRSPYRGLRKCSQHLSANCLQTFMSPDKRAIHCCPPCRHAQLLASADWAGE